MRADEARILAGEPVSTQSENSVDDVTQEFKDWLQDNASRIMKRLGDNFNEAWVNPKTGKTLTPTILKGANDKEIIEKLKKQLSQPGEYVLGYNYKNGDGMS